MSKINLKFGFVQSAIEFWVIYIVKLNLIFDLYTIFCSSVKFEVHSNGGEFATSLEFQFFIPQVNKIVVLCGLSSFFGRV